MCKLTCFHCTGLFHTSEVVECPTHVLKLNVAQKSFMTVFNRPGVARAVLQTALSLTDSFIESPFSSKYCCLYDQVAEVEQVSPLLQSGGVIRWRVCYQRALPCLVLTDQGLARHRPMAKRILSITYC